MTDVLYEWMLKTCVIGDVMDILAGPHFCKELFEG